MRGWKVWVEKSGKDWRCRWRGAYSSGQKVFTFKRDALEMAEKMRQAWQRKDAGLPPLPETDPGPDFPAFRSEYLAHLSAKRSKRTRYLAEHALKQWVAFAGERFPVTRKVKAAHGGHTVDDFCAFILNEQGQAVNGARINLRHLKAAFRWALKHDLLTYDPFLFFEMPPAEKVARLLRPAEVAAILQNLPEICARAAVFVLYTGLRVGEVLALDWSGIEEAGGKWYLTVLKSKTRRARSETKTQGIHSVALKAMGAPGVGRVFDVKRSRLNQTMARAARIAGLGRVRWHDLRHTWATYLMEESKDLKAVMDVGGWATHEAAMVYQHPTEKRRDVTLQNPYSVPSGPLQVEWKFRGPGKKRIENKS